MNKENDSPLLSPILNPFFPSFLAHLVYQPKSLNNHALSVVCRRCHWGCLCTCTSHTARHKNFIFGMNMPICTWYMHTKYSARRLYETSLVKAVTKFMWCNHATVTYILKILSIFLKFMYSLLL